MGRPTTIRRRSVILLLLFNYIDLPTFIKQHHNMLAHVVLFSLLLWTLPFASPANAEKVKIVTWNIRDTLSLGDIASREVDFQTFARELKPDILVLQEVGSAEVVEKLKYRMGLNNFHTAVSDFMAADLPGQRDLEIAVISKYPLTQILEFDPVPDSGESDSEEILITAPASLGFDAIQTNLGYLWVYIRKLRLTLSVVLLKSSGDAEGLGDAKNAEQREYVASAVALRVNQNLEFFPEHAHIVAGDFNVGHSDKKNGISLERDCYKNCGPKDRYDETHALLSAGLVDGLKMRNLASSVKSSTRLSKPGSPIDNIYVGGDLAPRFSSAVKEEKPYGSDHFPIWTIYESPQ